MMRRSASLITRGRSAPSWTRASASSKHLKVRRSKSWRAAVRAASLTRLARSAPLMPVVSRDRRSRETSSCKGVWRVCTLRIASRPTRSGSDRVIWRSKRPGRSNALSRMSTRFVAASTTTAWRLSNPSNSTSN